MTVTVFNPPNRLLDYEETIAMAAGEGIDLASKEPVYKWSYIQAVFFTSTILTTIGGGKALLHVLNVTFMVGLSLPIALKAIIYDFPFYLLFS